MRFGIQHGGFEQSDEMQTWGIVRRVGQACDDLGFDSFWMPDHFQFGDRPVLECWTTLGALAVATTRIRLGALVSGIPYRNPTLLAKMGTTLDVISNGRGIMGIGSAWHYEEFAAYGYDFETARERGERLAEAAQLIRAMLGQHTTTIRGRYYSAIDARAVPLTVQRPRPPMLIGGSGERVTLRIVAQYGDMCNVFGTPAEVRRRFAILHTHCDAVGRPYNEITRTNFGWCLIGRDEEEVAAKRARYMAEEPHAGIAGTPDQIIARLREYAAMGSQYFIFSMPDAHEIEPLRLFATEVLPALADL